MRYRGVVGCLVGTAFGVGVAVVVLPDLFFGLDRFTPFAQSVWLRPYLLVAMAAVAVAAVVLARRDRRALPAAVAVVAVLIVAAATVVPRTVAAPVPAAGRSLAVIAFNTFNGAADVAEVAQLIRHERPDAVALVEAGQSYHSRLAPLVEPFGYRLHTAIGEAEGDLGGVTAVVAVSLGDVRSTSGTASPFPFVQLDGGELGLLRFVVFHSLAPRRGDVPQWRTDLGQLPQWCATNTRWCRPGRHGVTPATTFRRPDHPHQGAAVAKRPRTTTRQEPCMSVVDNAIYIDGRRAVVPDSLDNTFEELRASELWSR